MKSLRMLYEVIIISTILEIRNFHCIQDCSPSCKRYDMQKVYYIGRRNKITRDYYSSVVLQKPDV